jgi:hypothetical protein
MANLLENGDEYLKSKLPADNNYGQNGCLNSSSTPLDKPVSSNFLPELRTDLDKAKAVNVQAKAGRTTGAQYPAAHGTRNRLLVDNYPQVPGNNRPVVKR